MKVGLHMNRRRNFSILTLVVLGVCLAPALAKICEDIHVGTDTKSSTIDDIIAGGETNKMWKEDSYSPVIVTHSKKIEYFYMINLDVDLNSSMVHLKYDNPQYANSTVNVKEETSKDNWYTLEVVYNCEAYGGALLTYTMEIDIPDCGSASFTWKKVCGYPLTPRDGFTIDMSYDDTKINIVKNGVPVNENFWDADVNDWAISIPKDVSQAKFDIYMNMDDIKKKQKEAGDSSLLVDSTVASVSETTVLAPKIDSDEAVASVEMTGAIVGKGGVIKEEKTTLTIDFICERVKDYSTVEFVIPMSNFRDINLFFYKDCDNARASLLFWLFIIVLAFVVYKIVLNVLQGKKGLDLIPYTFEAMVVLGWIWKTLSECLQKIFNASASAVNKNGGGSTSAGSYKSAKRYDPEANEFDNVKDINDTDADSAFDENKYGTI